MKLLQFIQKKFVLVGIDSAQKPFNEQRLMVLFACCASNVSTCVYLFLEADNFLEYANSIYLTTATIMITILYITLITRMEEIFALIDSYEGSIDKRLNYPVSKALFKNGNRQAEKWSSIIFTIIAEVTPIALLSLLLIASFFIYFTTDMGNEAFMLPIPVWIPFDWKNPVGYCVAMGLMYITAKFIFNAVACMTCIAFSVVIIFLTLIEDAKMALNSMQLNLKTEPQVQQQQQMEQLVDFVKLHLVAAQGVHDASNISQPFFFAFFTWSVVTTCITMLMLQIELSQPEIDAFPILLTIFYACYSFGILFVVCEIGHRTTTDFVEINDAFEQLEWYLFPDAINRMLSTILINLQQPVEIYYFGCNSTSRESMKKVCNTGFSYFMMLRKLDH